MTFVTVSSSKVSTEKAAEALRYYHLAYRGSSDTVDQTFQFRIPAVFSSRGIKLELLYFCNNIIKCCVWYIKQTSSSVTSTIFQDSGNQDLYDFLLFTVSLQNTVSVTMKI